MKNRVILITGASSGIGHAVAARLAGPDVTLLLAGRNADRLAMVEGECHQKGAAVETTVIDVTDRDAFEKKVLEWDDKHQIDLVFANAGVSGGTSMDVQQTESQLRRIIETNVIGTFNTVNPLIPRMTARKSGHIILMSSMAGFRGLPTAPAYSTSKVAVRGYGDALRPWLKRDGITVTTVFPGFVRTPLTDVNTFPMPFLMEVDDAAKIIQEGIDAKKAFIAFPWQMHAICWLLSVMPRCVSDFILSKAPKKN